MLGIDRIAKIQQMKTSLIVRFTHKSLAAFYASAVAVIPFPDCKRCSI
jgi:hypothetical protein